MQLCKVIRNEPIKNFVCVYKEENGIKHARVAQRTIYRAKYCQLTKKEIKAVFGNYRYTHVEQVNPSCWIIERIKDWNLATIYYREVNGEKEVFDIHYTSAVTTQNKRLENCRYILAKLLSDMRSSEVILINRIGNKFVGYLRPIQKASSICLIYLFCHFSKKHISL